MPSAVPFAPPPVDIPPRSSVATRTVSPDQEPSREEPVIPRGGVPLPGVDRPAGGSVGVVALQSPGPVP